MSCKIFDQLPKSATRIEYAQLSDAAFLSQKTAYSVPQLRAIDTEQYTNRILNDQVLVVRGQCGNILASLSMLPREGNVVELGSIWSEVRGGALTLIKHALDQYDKSLIALVTQSTNQKMCALATQIGFVQCDDWLSNVGLQQCVEKDIESDPNPNRVLFVRQI